MNLFLPLPPSKLYIVDAVTIPVLILASNHSGLPLCRLGTDVDKVNAAVGSVVGSLVDRFIPSGFECQCPALNSAGIPDIAVRRPRLKRVVKRKKLIWTGEFKRYVGNWAKANHMSFRDALNNPRLPAFPEDVKFKQGPNPNFLRFYFSCGRQWNHDLGKDENMKARCDYFGWADKVIDETQARVAADNIEEADALTAVFDYPKADLIYNFDDMYLSKRIAESVTNVVSKWLENPTPKGSTSEINEGRPADSVQAGESSGHNGTYVVGTPNVVLEKSDPQPVQGEDKGAVSVPPSGGQPDVANPSTN